MRAQDMPLTLEVGIIQWSTPVFFPSETYIHHKLPGPCGLPPLYPGLLDLRMLKQYTRLSWWESLIETQRLVLGPRRGKRMRVEKIASKWDGRNWVLILAAISPTWVHNYSRLLKMLIQLDEDARTMGYDICQDAPERIAHGVARKCWVGSKNLRKSLVKDFGELIMMFSSLANDDTTSDLVIKPEYYITENVQHHSAALRTCFNMRKETDFSFGNIGAEAMRGHLFLFNERPHQIGWSPVTSCRNLR